MNCTGLVSEERESFIRNLENDVIQGKKIMEKFLGSTKKKYIEASFKVAYLLGKSGKPYSDGELIKQCLISVSESLNPDLSIQKVQYLYHAIQYKENKLKFQIT